MTGKELRVLRALRRGPLYRPALELTLSLTEPESRRITGSLLKQGFVEIAVDVGPATYQLTTAGEEIVEAMTP
jgi:hypothetical protein